MSLPRPRRPPPASRSFRVVLRLPRAVGRQREGIMTHKAYKPYRGPARRRRMNPEPVTRACVAATAYVAEPLEQRVLLSFAAIGPEFPVNATTAGNQNESAVAADADGDFVVAWQSNGNTAAGPNQDASGY